MEINEKATYYWHEDKDRLDIMETKEKEMSFFQECREDLPRRIISGAM